ncbi:MAG: hypothetical protein J6Y96_01340 [Mycoplasma sp.]|nr:hypothetical protein [Mycoplasma sp.]
MSKYFSIKTKPWKITLLVVLTIIIFLIILILIGELDLLDVDYIVAKNGVLWSGKVTYNNIDWLVSKYEKYGVTTLELNKRLDTNIIIHNTLGAFANPLLFIYLFSGLVLCILITFILRLFKLVWWDVLPFNLSTGVASFIFIISALIDYWNENESWWYLLRMFIFIISLVISFFVCNFIVKHLVKNSTYITQYINDLKSEKQAADKINKQSNQILDTYKKQKDKNAITSIEVKKSNKK